MNLLGHVIFYIFIFISFVTTAIGLTVLLPWYLAVPLSLAVSGGMAFLAPNLVPRWHQKTRVIIAWLVYPLLTSFSIFFATAFYFQHFSAQSLATERAEQSELAFLDALNTLHNRYQTLAGGLDDLAQYSQQQARREETHGGTCAGTTGTGRGPIWAMRRWQADYFTDAARQFRTIEQQLQQELRDLRLTLSATDDPSQRLRILQHRIPNLKQYNRRPEIEHLLTDLAQQNHHQMNGYPQDPAYNYQNVPFGGHYCRDTRLAQRIDTLETLGVPQVTLPQIASYDPGDLQQNLDLVINVWLDLLTGSGNELRLEGNRLLSFGAGIFIDLIILGLGFYLGLERRSHPVARRLNPARTRRLIQRLEDIINQYPEAFPLHRMPAPKYRNPRATLRRIQIALDAISQPAGSEKVVLLPTNSKKILKSHRRKGLSDSSERRLEAVIAILETLSHYRLLGEPLRIPNRHTHYQGHDTHTVAKWYGLDRNSVEAFAVYLLPPELMSEATSLLTQPPPRLLPHHQNHRRRLMEQHPDYFAAEPRVLESGCNALTLQEQAEILLLRVENIRLVELIGPKETDEQSNETTTGHRGEITLYPRLFALDRCLEKLLRDDDYGLHQDLDETRRSRLAQLIYPYRHFRLGPKSYAALQNLVETSLNHHEPGPRHSTEHPDFEDFDDDIPF